MNEPLAEVLVDAVHISQSRIPNSLTSVRFSAKGGEEYLIKLESESVFLNMFLSFDPANHLLHASVHRDNANNTILNVLTRSIKVA